MKLKSTLIRKSLNSRKRSFHTRNRLILMKKKTTHLKKSLHLLKRTLHPKRPLQKKQQNTHKIILHNACTAGEQAALIHNIDQTANPIKALNHLWHQWFSQSSGQWKKSLYSSAAASYLQGYCARSGRPLPNWVLVPSIKSIGAVITVMNEEKTIISVLEELKRLPIDEIIVIINGSSDNSLHQVRVNSQALIVHYPLALGHDVGRAIGAKMAKSEILLFLDGDFPVLAEHLVPFIHAIDQGLDVAMNDISPYLPLFSSRDRVTTMKEFINRSMGRPDLNANSLTAIPHALSRNAVEKIGYSSLIVPPKALMAALQSSLNIGAPMSVDVISSNKTREHNTGEINRVADLIIGDHMEALGTGMGLLGKRLFYHDNIRKRALAGVGEP